jgi:hypothetical protein
MTSRWVTPRQVASALRDEVTDLEAAGIRVIQVGEPALRELLPLRAVDADWLWVNPDCGLKPAATRRTRPPCAASSWSPARRVSLSRVERGGLRGVAEAVGATGAQVRYRVPVWVGDNGVTLHTDSGVLGREP